ncbi:MAG: dienelactone hydrolase family protein [Pseudomonadales bacterium]
MTLRTRFIEYRHGDVLLEGMLAWDDVLKGPRPAVAVAHTWAGRGEFECDKAKLLAGWGYAGFAVDMFGKGVRGSSAEENSALIAPFMADRDLLAARINAGIDALATQPEAEAGKLAAIGFCFGGLCVLDLARSGRDVKGVVSLHGLLQAPPQRSEKISASILCLHGYADPMAPPESVLALGEELSAAAADWQLHAYGNTLHAFTNPNANDRAFGTVYDPRAARRAWHSTRGFLQECLA